MGRPVLTDEQIHAFRARATDAAMRLFVRDGYGGFSIRALAKELGCSHATPYRYFEGKDELFAAVRAEGLRRFTAFLRARLEGVAEHDARLRALAHGYFDFARREPEAFAITFEMSQPSEGWAFVDEAAAEGWGVLHEVVGGAAAAGVLEGEVNTLAHTMWAGIHGVATLHVAGKLRMGRTGEEVVAHMIDALIRAHAPAGQETKR